MEATPVGTSAPPASAHDIEALCREIDVERNRGRSRDCLLARMSKTIKVMFSCIVLEQELPQQ